MLFRSLGLRRIWTLVWAIALMLLLLEWAAWSTWSIPAMLYLIFLAAAFGILECTSELRLLCVLAGIVLFVIPLGSGDGIHLSLYVMPLALPTALMVLLNTKSSTCRVAPVTPSGSASDYPLRPLVGERKLNWAGLRLNSRCDMGAVGWAVMLCIVGFSVAHGAVWTHRDSPDRLAMRTPIAHPKLRGIFTTSSRARALEELLKELKPLVRKDDYLLDHMQIPLVYFLTETRPYLYSSWANVYEPPVFQQALNRALSTRTALPVCVITKIDTSHPTWPNETYPPLPYFRHVENRRMVWKFLREHDYQKHWENTAFEIWLPRTAA